MSAVFSYDRRYRYRLDRDLATSGPPVAFLLHNPSTAGETVDDPTSRRGIGFARAWGASKLIFVNPWAGVATKPDDLWRMSDPVGPMNDFHLQAVAREVADGGGFVVFAWGAISPPRRLQYRVSDRLYAVRRIFAACDCRALGLTKNGQPRHPLYLKTETEPVAFAPAGGTNG